LNSVITRPPIRVQNFLEAAGLFRDGHRQHRFPLFAQFRPFRHEAQAVEIHVGAGGDGHQVPVLRLLPRRPDLGAGHAQGAGGLQDGTGVLEHVLDGGADGVVVHPDHLVHVLLAQAEGLLAHLLHRHAVGEDAHLGQDDALLLAQGAGHGVGLFRLHADDPDFRRRRLM
jgi:hypothetical protein